MLIRISCSLRYLRRLKRMVKARAKLHQDDLDSSIMCFKTPSSASVLTEL